MELTRQEDHWKKFAAATPSLHSHSVQLIVADGWTCGGADRILIADAWF